MLAQSLVVLPVFLLMLGTAVVDGCKQEKRIRQNAIVHKK